MREGGGGGGGRLVPGQKSQFQHFCERSIILLHHFYKHLVQHIKPLR
jgi:hypothetical protein